MTDEKVKCLSGFVARVRHIREEWRIDEHKELWFRGEGEKHQESILRPGLYRPPKSGHAMKGNCKCELYEDFQRCGATGVAGTGDAERGSVLSR